LSHASFHKALIDLSMTTPTGFLANIMNAGIIDIQPLRCRLLILLFGRLTEEARNYNTCDK